MRDAGSARAMAGEGQQLLERRAVRPAHRVREHARREADPLARRVGPPATTDPGPAPPRAPPRRRRSRAQSASRQVASTPRAAVAARERAREPARRGASAGPCPRTRTSPRCTPSRRARGRRSSGGAPRDGRRADRGAASRTASASRGHAASRTAAPGASILPSRSRVEAASTGCAPRVDERGGRLGARARRRPGLEHIARRAARRAPTRRSCVAALFIAAVTLASVCFLLPRAPP